MDHGILVFKFPITQKNNNEKIENCIKYNLKCIKLNNFLIILV